MLTVWRGLLADPARPPWATGLLHRLRSAEEPPSEGTEPARAGLFGKFPEARGRLLGMLHGCATAEAFVRGSTAATARTTAVLSVVESLVHAHAEWRTSGDADPVSAALRGQQRWLHSRGLAWQDCVPHRPDETEPRGWLAADERMRTAGEGDAVTLTALARIAAGERPGSPEEPGNGAGSAGAVPLGAAAALWAADAHSALVLGERIAALTHGGPDGHRPAGVLAAVLFAVLRGEDLESGSEAALGLLPHDRPCEQPAEAVRLARFRPAGLVPSRRNLEAAADGNTGSGALAVALRAALGCSGDFTGALRVASDHGGDTAASAMLCGQLLGALHGPEVLGSGPHRAPSVAPLLERVTAEAASEFGPRPENPPQWTNHHPTRSQAEGAEQPERAEERGHEPAGEDWQSRFVQCVRGCAAGEALGGAVTAETWREIRDRYGSEGIREYVPAGYPSGRIGSETQLLLFTLEGVVRAGVAGRSGDCPRVPTRQVQHACQRWLHTQHLSWARAAGEFLSTTPEPDGWLVEQRALFQTRTPGRTMMRTLIAFAKGQREMGDPETPETDSDGSTALLRAVPAALWSAEDAETFHVAAELAALTHGHRDVRLSTGVLAVLIARLLRGASLSEGITAALEELDEHPEGGTVRAGVGAALELAESGVVPPERVENTLGAGFKAVEALGIGLYSALSAHGDFATGLRIAVNHSGNSSVCGAVSGGLLALSAPETVGEHWFLELELREAVERMATDAAREFGPAPPDTPEWFERYPAS
ncbi:MULTISPECIES: ADP-ribosylglycohydrolase family protein [unclassified Actinopolyspora]|uniref:ADP-ribosylglycohydrolase family protein n=1 Tax=unclassified Actinopolyspora TaxID=2639451 RepID=UPI001F60BEB0|nr:MULTISPECIES: ADP-ribosylglycohydrolase family protein [unclassified Actinopolyspora]